MEMVLKNIPVCNNWYVNSAGLKYTIFYKSYFEKVNRRRGCLKNPGRR